MERRQFTREFKLEAVRLHRALLQSETPTLDDRIFKSYGVREAGRISLSGCQQNRVQLRGYRRILRGLARFHHATPKFWMKDLEQHRTNSYFNFMEYRREVEIYECRVTRRWGWNRRDSSSSNWTEFELFYRIMTFRWAQATLREHILLELNLLLTRLGINAEIKVSGLPTSENILGLRSEMVFGNISYAKAHEVTSI